MPRPPDPLDDLDPRFLVEITKRLLGVGVPPTAIANAFGMEPAPLEAVAVQIRREAYGTAEMSEAMSFLAWKAYERLLNMMDNAAPEIQLKAVMQVAGKSMQTAARATPEEMTRSRAEFAQFVDEIGAAEADTETEEDYERVRREYVPVATAADED